MGLRPSFDCPRLPTEGSFGNLILGNHFDKVGDQLFSEFCGGCAENGGQPVVEPVDGSLEAGVLTSHRFPAGHQCAQKVVGDDVD